MWEEDSKRMSGFRPRNNDNRNNNNQGRYHSGRR
jgi:hypothetical protein